MANHQTPEVRRAQILDAAQRCFGRTGFHKTKMDDIVEASGLSKGALYWHFKSKDEIFLALFDQFDRAIFAAWDDLPDANTLETLRIESEIVLGALLSDRALVEMWSEFLKHPLARKRFAVLYQDSRARLGSTIETGIARGEIAACDPRHAAAMLTAVIEGLLLQALADASFNPFDAWPTTWQILSAGMTSNL
jgi:AcrR family transcriptional regulator